MFPDIAYLDFAARWFGKVRYDLATSGLKPVTAAELGGAAVDDFGARERFIAAIALRYGVPAEEVVPCLGASGALFVAYATLLERGSALLAEEPAYEPLWRVAEALGIRVERFRRGLGRLEPELVLDAVTEGVELVVLSNPHNPSSALTDDRSLMALASALEQRGIRLLVDEAYLEGVAPKRCARALAPNILTCSSVTKCLGVPWARAGFLILPEADARRADRVELHTAGRAPPASWAFGELALSQAERLLERARCIQTQKREIVDAFMARHADSLVWDAPPAGSLFGWLQDRRGRRSLELVEKGIESRGVIVSPGIFFGDPCAFRMSWTADSPALERGLELLEEVLEL